MNNIITHDLINKLDTEIVWKEAVNPQNFLVNPQMSHSTLLSLSNGTQIKVFFNDAEYFELLGEKFEILCESNKENVLGTLYFESEKCNRALGSIDTNSKVAYVIGDGFGILKSAVSGLSTLWGDLTQKSLPIHGSAMTSPDIGGLMMVGSHGGGKTTGLLNIMDILGKGEIVSDDWLIGNFKINGLNISTTDNSVSLSQKSFKENSHINRINKENIKTDLLKRKKSYKPEVLFGEGVIKHHEAITIKTIVLLVSGVKKDISVITDLYNVPEFIVQATYHFPYYNNHIKNKHLFEWRNGLNGANINIITFDYSHFNNITEGYTKLINTILIGKI
ncbi:MAG: hypothetical protein WC850_05655 [Candidatus Gracilibacteria bacterium]